MRPLPPEQLHAGTPGRHQRVDTQWLRQHYPIEDVAARYGIELQPRGRALVGFCPFHPDVRKPNLHIYPDTASFYCYRCQIGGDVFTLIERLDGVDFLEAVARLTGQSPVEVRRRRLATAVSRPRRAGYRRGPASQEETLTTQRFPVRRRRGRDVAEQACLSAAVELYANSLLANPEALDYVEGRGLTRATIEACHLGYASGSELAPYLRWRGLPLRAARRAGLLRADHRDTLAGRIVVPEIRRGQPLWLVGRALAGSPDEPKYLGLAGTKPLLGWEWACQAASEAPHPGVVIVEGPFDWLTLRQWDIPAVALVGTRARADALRALRRFDRLFVLLDADDAGRDATAALLEQLGPNAYPVTLEGLTDATGAKDVSDLATVPEGREIVSSALRQALAATGPRAA